MVSDKGLDYGVHVPVMHRFNSGGRSVYVIDDEETKELYRRFQHGKKRRLDPELRLANSHYGDDVVYFASPEAFCVDGIYYTHPLADDFNKERHVVRPMFDIQVDGGCMDEKLNLQYCGCRGARGVDLYAKEGDGRFCNYANDFIRQYRY